ncbi:MAG: zinc carboxypeptidase [Chitinophagaceae bacterium]|nr:zinc carboxypeptidase [Chitinophagaceae bacterium]
MKKQLLLLLLISASLLQAQQLKSPDEFLGYPLGSKYTPHYKIVNYFNYVATAASGQMKLQQYGETNEGRPLLLAFIASAGNAARLEDIRKNNLRLTGMLTDKPADINAPAIVWLSYNVHGNETSSSEVAMKMLYELLNPTNTQSAAYLSNVVVIIDPCINPDGRDRYVNWQAQVVGRNVNPDPNGREHNEPWPGGRSNHYNFDLNRDWAWQTQVETKQRIKVYNQWMPQVHSDYHEQGYNNPYYFAPAAEPYHEVITPFQRSFQVEIGKNNAKYFDANGWLYFTKEVFDLFYPSYGDTYPVYNGSIGMTFEQAGLSRASTAVITNTGDTLTLKDRIAHHFTTSMSTIEVVSKNTGRVITAFKKFFDDARAGGVGEYKTFVVTDVATNRIDGLKRLLDDNAIQYTYSSGAALKGYNYFTQKEEAFTTSNSLVVSTYQPKGVLAKVLFEPVSKLADSATYDITAWALPYVYGLQSYAVKEKIAGENKAVTGVTQAVIPLNAYGYLVRYSSFEDSKLLAAILQAGIKVRFAERDFSIANKKFSRGTLIVLRKGNEEKLDELQRAAKMFNASVTPIESGFMDTGFDVGSEKVHFIKKPNVAMITGKGAYSESAGEVWHLFDQQLNYPITLINADDVNNVNWKNIDVLIVSGGRYKFLSDKEASADLKNWVRQGGKIIAIENAVSQMATGEWGIKIKKSEEDKDKEKKDDKPNYEDLKKFAESEHDGIRSYIAGAVYRIDLDITHPLAFGLGDNYYTLKQDDKVYEFFKEGWNVGVIKKDNYVAGFVGSKIKDKIKDAMLIGEQPMGSGDIIYLADNPIFRNFWESGKLLLANAVFFAGQ